MQNCYCSINKKAFQCKDKYKYYGLSLSLSVLQGKLMKMKLILGSLLFIIAAQTASAVTLVTSRSVFSLNGEYQSVSLSGTGAPDVVCNLSGVSRADSTGDDQDFSQCAVRYVSSTGGWILEAFTLPGQGGDIWATCTATCIR